MPESENSLPPELELFSALLDAQAPPVRQAFQYCLCLLMIEAGVLRLLHMIPGDSLPLCVFETAVGETFTIPRPPLSREQEEDLLTGLRQILDDEGIDLA